MNEESLGEKGAERMAARAGTKAATDKEKQAGNNHMPSISNVEQMPRPRRGRQGMDLTPFEELLQDFKGHAIENISDRNDREKWARRVRTAAKNIGLEVETTYSEDEKRLYFRGYKEGEAPARGRRSTASRKTKE